MDTLSIGELAKHANVNVETIRYYEPAVKKGMFAAVTGTVLVALCCFTPITVILLGAVGLSVFTPSLDFELLPAL